MGKFDIEYNSIQKGKADGNYGIFQWNVYTAYPRDCFAVVGRVSKQL